MAMNDRISSLMGGLDTGTGADNSRATSPGGDWRGVLAAILLTGMVHVALHLAREAHLARISRRRRFLEIQRAAPDLPEEEAPRAVGLLGRRSERLLVMESPRPQAWSLPLPSRPLQLVVSTAAMRRLSTEQLDAVLAIERAHARARHHLLVQSACALATAFPGAALFTAYADSAARLVELAADDAAAHLHGNLATALALLDLNETRVGQNRPTAPLPWTPGTPPPPPAEQITARADRLKAARVAQIGDDHLGHTLAERLGVARCGFGQLRRDEHRHGDAEHAIGGSAHLGKKLLVRLLARRRLLGLLGLALRWLRKGRWRDRYRCGPK